MARNVFSQEPPKETPNRNSFDLSFANNLSFNIGDLVPVFCKEVIPGDTFNIDSAFGLRLMPMSFPVQTRMRAHLSFFYCRNRTLWKNWKKFLRSKDERDQSVVMPYISGNAEHIKRFFSTSSLADYLGCPTFTVKSFTDSWEVPMQSQKVVDYFENMTSAPFAVKEFKDNSVIGRPMLGTFRSGSSLVCRMFPSSVFCERPLSPGNLTIEYTKSTAPSDASLSCRIVILQSNTLDTLTHSEKGLLFDRLFKFDSEWSYYRVIGLTPSFTLVYNSTNYAYETALPDAILDEFGNQKTFSDYFSINTGKYIVGLVFEGVGTLKDKTVFNHFGTFSFPFTDYMQTDDTITDKLKINALPFRAYQQIYNAIYRNSQNDPFVKDGHAEYDEFLTYDGDGADTTDYKIERVYYEKDFMTTALPSPQQGNAPLLGFSQNTDVFTSGTSGVKYYEMPVTYSDDANNKVTKSLRFTVNSSGLVTTVGSTAATGHLDTELQGVLTALNSAAGFGISINDLRNVNSLQRWLEKAIKNGYRYRDVIRAHFGIEIALRELDMPEFLGGITENVNVQGVTQSSESDTTPLGWQAGQAGVFARSEHRISKYCDEHGFIIGLMYVTPIPSYSQLLPKMFSKFGVLDYFDPAFAHIGMQPIKYREVAPLQVLAGASSGKENEELEKVFGYQRAWYDYLASTDEVHGEFRSSLANFLMTRTFAKKPVLGGDFLKVDSEDTNNVFVVTTPGDHKVYGQLYFDVVAERPIPLYDEPRLE